MGSVRPVARAGWVSAETASGAWRRLSVFDDGWVELPGYGRAMSDLRRNRRDVLQNTGVALAAGVVTLASSTLGGPTWLTLLGALVVLAALVRNAWQSGTARSRNAAQLREDAEERRREAAAGHVVRMRPGAPRWRRASSAAELAGWLDGGELVSSSDLVEVVVETPADGAPTRVEVVLVDGSRRTYASPDAALARLLGRFADRSA